MKKFGIKTLFACAATLQAVLLSTLAAEYIYVSRNGEEFKVRFNDMWINTKGVDFNSIYADISKTDEYGNRYATLKRNADGFAVVEKDYARVSEKSAVRIRTYGSSSEHAYLKDAKTAFSLPEWKRKAVKRILETSKHSELLATSYVVIRVKDGLISAADAVIDGYSIKNITPETCAEIEKKYAGEKQEE